MSLCSPFCSKPQQSRYYYYFFYPAARSSDFMVTLVMEKCKRYRIEISDRNQQGQTHKISHTLCLLLTFRNESYLRLW